MKVYKLILGMIVMLLGFTSCHNNDVTYPDFDYQTVYFATQYPVRTVELGNDLFVDNSLDNQHKIVIKATTGGAYSNENDIYIDYVVDESLCDDLYFSDSDVEVLAMPSSYYSLASNQIKISSGEILGGVEVQLTDAFFADSLALSTNYVIPLLMNGVSGVDSILSGTPSVDNPDRVVEDDWSIKPKDFVLYAVKYVNPWHGNYLRRGIDQITDKDGAVNSSVRHADYVEENEKVSISTASLTQSILGLRIKQDGSNDYAYELVLTFSEDGTCVISSNSDSYDISGTGKFVEEGEINSIGGFDRDALYLDYNVDFKDLNLQYVTKDTLVVKDRGVVPEYYSVTKQ